MMGDVTIRAARKSDAAELAILDSIASSGLAPWLWHGGVMRGVASTAMEHGRNLMADETVSFGHVAADIAEVDDAVCGMMISYEVDMPDGPPDFGDIANAVLNGCLSLVHTVQGQWYVDGLAVYQQYRGQGIARSLLQGSFEKARLNNCSTVSLLTEDTNHPALGLYHSMGFIIIDECPYVPFNDTATAEKWLLLSAPVE